MCPISEMKRRKATCLNSTGMIAFEHADKPGAISFMEVYKDEQALDAHTKTAHYAEFFAVLQDHLEGGLQSLQVNKGAPFV